MAAVVIRGKFNNAAGVLRNVTSRLYLQSSALLSKFLLVWGQQQPLVRNMVSAGPPMDPHGGFGSFWASDFLFYPLLTVTRVDSYLNCRAPLGWREFGRYRLRVLLVGNHSSRGNGSIARWPATNSILVFEHRTKIPIEDFRPNLLLLAVCQKHIVLFTNVDK